MPSLIPSFLFFYESPPETSSVPVVIGGEGGVAEEWCHVTFLFVTSICTLTFNNCVSCISLVLDQCVKTNDILSLLERALSDADLRASGEAEMYYAANTHRLWTSVQWHIYTFWVEFPFTTTFQKQYWQSQELFYWPGMRLTKNDFLRQLISHQTGSDLLRGRRIISSYVRADFTSGR